MRINKKLTFVLLIIVCFFTMCLVFTACGKHTHTYIEIVVKATCTEQGYTLHKCSCGEEYKDTYIRAIGHDYCEWISNGDGTHTKTCSHDSVHTVTENCHDGNANCINKAICVDCGENYGELKAHEYATDWSKNETQHWHECFCGDKTDIANHIPSAAATETTAQVCIECGYVIAPALEHVHKNHLTKVSAKDSTCTEEGNILYYTCSCGRWFENETAKKEITDKNSVAVAKKTHSFTFERTGQYYLKKPATCKEKAVYYYSCTCGEKGTETFEYGKLTDHILDESGWCTVCLQSIEPTNGVLYDISVDGTYAEVIGYTGLSKKVKIASFWNDLPVKNIYNDAFKNADIAFIDIPDSITSIGNMAFYHCTSLINIAISDNIVSIGDSAFEGCWQLTDIPYPKSLIYIGDRAFSGCASITSVIMGDNVELIGNEAFSYCRALTTITLSKKIVNIGRSVFSSCDKLCYNEYDNVNYLGTSDNPYFALINVVNKNCSSYIIHQSTNIIAEKAFSSCSRLINASIPCGVNRIGFGTFSDCDNLKELILPFVGAAQNEEKDTHLGYIFGANDYNTNSWYIPQSLTKITLTDCIKLGHGAFSGCGNLTSISIPNSMICMEKSAFADCVNLSMVNYMGTIDQWCQIIFEGALANPLYWAKKLHLNNELITEINITQATSISAYAFFNCDSVTSITFSNCVFEIGEHAFDGCEGLTNLEIPISVTHIGKYALYNCNNLLQLTIPFVGADRNEKSDTYFGYIFGASEYSDNNRYIPSKLSNVKLTASTNIADYAFYHCRQLKTISLPDTITSIGDLAFCGCNKLSMITIPNNVTSIGRYAFAYCDDLSSIIIPSNVISIDTFAFGDCSSLTIYCQKESAPSGWSYSWVSSDCLVYWYSATPPTDQGRYWHYDTDGIAILKW